MIFFITFLRALAACLITNAHYTGIYPTDIIANGGLLGDVLFFAVSGYCLYNIKNKLSISGFLHWYVKRLWRVFPPVIIITLIYMLLGAYNPSEHNLFWWYVYPTNYHFVGSIILLYIPFFFIMKTEWIKQKLPLVMLVIASVWLIVYYTMYDRTYYHIDNVREPMIRFLFMESMLLGAWFRQNDQGLRNKFKFNYPVSTLIIFVMYFISKMLFSKSSNISSLQFLNQIVLFILLWLIFRTFCGLDKHLESLPLWAKDTIQFLADMTLEIYVVQYVLIDYVRGWTLSFPLNWVALTTIIILSACILSKLCGSVYNLVNYMLNHGDDN